MSAVKYQAKILEVILDGARQGTIHLNLNGKLQVAKNKLEQSFQKKITRKNLLEVERTCLLNYQDYMTTLQKGIQEDFPNQVVQVRERNVGPYWEQKYGKSLAKGE